VLMAQKSPTTFQISGGRPGPSVRFLTVIAEAEALVKRSAAKLARPSFIMRMRFLQTYIDLSQHAGRHLSVMPKLDKAQALEFGRNGIISQDVCLGYH
ncbi:MAG: hypothetical protein WB713_10020, partial [Methyloceanibacter sp.]